MDVVNEGGSVEGWRKSQFYRVFGHISIKHMLKCNRERGKTWEIVPFGAYKNQRTAAVRGGARVPLMYNSWHKYHAFIMQRVSFHGSVHNSSFQVNKDIEDPTSNPFTLADPGEGRTRGDPLTAADLWFFIPKMLFFSKLFSSLASLGIHFKSNFNRNMTKTR